MLYQKKATMRFLIVLLFIIMNVVGSAQVPKKGALSGYIAKLEKEIADAKMYQADSARIAELEKILAQMKFTQAYLDKGVAKKQKTNTKAGVRWTGTMTRDIVTVHSNELYQGKITEKIVVNFNSTYGFENVLISPKVQTEYTQGVLGVYTNPPGGIGPAWGPTIAEAKLIDPTHPDQLFNNYDQAFGTGQQVKNSVSLTGGSDAIKFFSSISQLYQKGMMPNTDNKNLSANSG